MKISIECNSFEELYTELAKIIKADGPDATASCGTPPEPKTKKTKETAPKEEPPAPAAPDPEPDNSISLEDLQSQAKNALAEANTKSGERLSTKWCNELAGKGMKVKDITDPEILMELIRRSKEVTG